MNTNIAIGIVVAVVVLGGGYYVMTQGSMPTTEGVQGNLNEAPIGTEAEAGKFNGSFSELATRGGSWKCTVDTSTAESISSGVTYVSGGSMRADFTTSVQGFGNVESHVLVSGQDVYTWSSMMPQGIKTTLSAQATGGTATSGQGMDANTDYSYDCQPWTADTALFVVPTNITFKTL